ncbi:MAG: hypothetical protein U0132_13370 [Gemmatimonadaceae bacterium]
MRMSFPFSALALALSLSSCRRSDAAQTTPGDAAALPVSVLQPQPASPDPCSWVSAAEAEHMLGRLNGAPRRGHDASNDEPTTDGRACVYPLAPGAGANPPQTVAVELLLEDAATQGAAFDAGANLAAQILGGSRADQRNSVTADSSERAPLVGWDYTSALPEEFLGRLGHIAVLITAHGGWLPGDSVAQLAAMIRDRIPDRPFASPPATLNQADGPDPCGLVSRNDAESVLGPLALPPYRSTGESPLADPTGAGCSYYLGRHRVFTMKPEWEDGRALFNVAAGASRMFGAAAGVRGEAADTLEGAWDQAADGLDGTLYFLTGDRMLTVLYRTAHVSKEAALKIATLAVARLR